MKYSDKDLLDSLREAEEEIIPLTSDKFDQHDSYPSKATIKRRFGSWSSACNKANVQSGQVTEKSILSNIKKLYNSGEIENSEDFFNHPETTSAATFYKNFDTWREAVDNINIDAYTEYINSDLTSSLQQFNEEYGYISQRKFKYDTNYPSSTTLIRRFGSWNEAVKAADIEPNPSGVAGREETTGEGKELFGSNWYKQREKALERDNFSCQICNSETNLHVHHDKQRSTYRDSEVFDVSESNKLENLHSLCENCHYAVHSNEKSVAKQSKSSLAPRVVQ